MPDTAVNPSVITVPRVCVCRVVASAERAAASAQEREGVESSVGTLNMADADSKGDTQTRCVPCVLCLQGIMEADRPGQPTPAGHNVSLSLLHCAPRLQVLTGVRIVCVLPLIFARTLILARRFLSDALDSWESFVGGKQSRLYQLPFPMQVRMRSQPGI